MMNNKAEISEDVISVVKIGNNTFHLIDLGRGWIYNIPDHWYGLKLVSPHYQYDSEQSDLEFVQLISKSVYEDQQGRDFIFTPDPVKREQKVKADFLKDAYYDNREEVKADCFEPNNAYKVLILYRENLVDHRVYKDDEGEVIGYSFDLAEGEKLKDAVISIMANIIAKPSKNEGQERHLKYIQESVKRYFYSSEGDYIGSDYSDEFIYSVLGGFQVVIKDYEGDR